MLRPVIFVLFFGLVMSAPFTFNNIIVTCENEDVSDSDEIYAITVTGANLKPHLYPDLFCDRIEIKHSFVPILYEGALADIDRVNILVLENDAIETIYAGAFKNTKIREGMSLKFNRLTEIREGVFNELQLPALHLGYNFISRIDPNAFDNMTALKEIYLDNNRLTFIDNHWFKNTPRLNKLVFKKNQVQRVPAYAFMNFVTRKYYAPEVDLSRNLIKTVDRDAFKSINKTARFYQLNLAYNQIEDLSLGWLSNVEVNMLDLSYNNLKCLRHGGLAPPFSTNLIDGNFWNCGCLRDIKIKGDRGEYGNIIANDAFKKCNIV